MNTKITDIKAEQILDSRNNPTLKVSVFVGDLVGIFEVPSGASTGKYEACEMRDGEDGKSGVKKAIDLIENIIKPELIGIEIKNQSEIDQIMIDLDKTPQKTKLGGNSMIGVSVACAKVGALVENIETFEYLRSFKKTNTSQEKPLLYFNLINGGKHTKTELAFQEYHIVPQVDSIERSVHICREIENKLDEIIKEEFSENISKGDEGGLALPVVDVKKPLSLLKRAAKEAGFEEQIMFALDVAASSFYNHDRKIYSFMNKDWTTNEMIELYKELSREYKIISIEDPLDEEDFEGFALLQESIPQVKLVGDDLTVTNKERLQKAINEKSIKAIIIKPNQIGTLTETIETIELAHKNKIDCIVSHRSGETMDTFISDLTYAFHCFGLKSGALGPKERDIKYERLINITK
ncbi:MAG: enolase C-terminal domain-like protein [Candidatus Pacebacteria bacterium]|nr:enolase C-terminal domain-like protein [Candidatus Paceibacterota bacterium]